MVAFRLWEHRSSTPYALLMFHKELLKMFHPVDEQMQWFPKILHYQFLTGVVTSEFLLTIRFNLGYLGFYLNRTQVPSQVE